MAHGLADTSAALDGARELARPAPRPIPND
jgi:hypothetical protein